MASSSSTLSCFHCSSYSSSDLFRNGWRFRSGDFAQLCPRCAFLYEGGKFCETFHSKDDGWRDCESCGKLVHCGCVVSFGSYLLMDLGGVICKECSKLNLILERSRHLMVETPVQIINTHQDPSRQVHIHHQFWPRVTDIDLQQIFQIPNSSVSPLFQRTLSVSDADPRLARLVIPRGCAEAFFPILTNQLGCIINILDTDGKEWEFLYHYWNNRDTRTYVLEGLKDYMVLKNCQAGDTVTFYRVEPEGKLMMGLRKASAAQHL